MGTAQHWVPADQRADVQLPAGARAGDPARDDDDGHGPIAASTRVLLVDDHRSFSEALAAAIDQFPDLACVGTPTTIRDAVTEMAQSKPDVVLVDIHLPDGDGIDAIATLRDGQPAARFLVMTGYTDVDVLARAATAGACGFLPKESSVRSILEAIRTARDGGMLVDGSTLAAILGRVGTQPGSARAKAVAESRLTSRELDVLSLMRQGLDPHAIATRLTISLHTCRGYQKSILAKLDAHSQLEAVVIGARRGLVDRLDPQS